MATARDLIKRSLGLIHVLDSGESMTADEANDSLNALNDMLDSWSVPGLYIYTTKSETVTWPASTESRTIGSSGNFNTTRPTAIHPATFYTVSGEDFPLEILETRASYTHILDKDTSTSHPEYLYYEPQHPLGVLYLWPVPTANLSLTLVTPEQLDQIASLDTTFAYPPGYKKAMVYNLCAELAGVFGVALPPEVADERRRANRAIRRLNREPAISTLELPGDGGRYNIFADRP